MGATGQIVGICIAALGVVLSFYAIINKQTSTFKEEIEKRFLAIDKKFEEVATTSNNGFSQVTSHFNAMAIQVNTILEGDVRELRGRITMLESGQGEWTKTLRDRTHELAGKVDRLNLKVILLENGVKLEPNKSE